MSAWWMRASPFSAFHTCARTAAGVAWCWGFGDNGAIGDNGAFHRNQPTLVAGGLTFTQLSAGYYHTCAVDQSGAAWCWGDNGAQPVPGTGPGILGTGSVAGLIAQPAQVSGGLEFAELSAGMGFTCGRTVAGALRCWGVNTHGNLGDQTSIIRTAPAAVFATGSFQSIAAGAFHACARASSNEVWCWGRNAFGQLGDGTSQSRSQPVKVLGTTLFTRLSANASNTCAISTVGEAWCWGTAAVVLWAMERPRIRAHRFRCDRESIDPIERFHVNQQVRYLGDLLPHRTPDMPPEYVRIPE